MKPERTIIQIISAQGWNAVYAVRPDRNNNDPVWVSALACWALVQEGVDRYVVGLDLTLSFCDSGDNFLGYLPPDQDPAEWKEEALRNVRVPNKTTKSKNKAIQ